MARNLFSNKTMRQFISPSWQNGSHKEKINVLERPSKSLHLNLIENVLGYLTKKVYQNGKQYQSVQDLQTAILRAWPGMPQKYLISSIGSMPN